MNPSAMIDALGRASPWRISLDTADFLGVFDHLWDHLQRTEEHTRVRRLGSLRDRSPHARPVCVPSADGKFWGRTVDVSTKADGTRWYVLLVGPYRDVCDGVYLDLGGEG